MIAKFIGQNNSLGLEHGKHTILLLRKNSNDIILGLKFMKTIITLSQHLNIVAMIHLRGYYPIGKWRNKYENYIKRITFR